ncbi:hypothetical protein M5K25_016039 [Dendrobium thyrsiflorum]|uniref:Uncharacterized protein n=1 Tax=Dendrobium thyrsiflorum TaxID=117978 RepID=A0ABD0US57_DENTH
MLRSDDPPEVTAARAISFHFLARFSIASASGPSVAAVRHRTISARAAGVGRRTPIPWTSQRNLASGTWSPHWGKAMAGTPAAMSSRVEFQPQWVTKQARDLWARTFSCGLHSTRRLLPSASISSSKPFGSSSRRYVGGPRMHRPLTGFDHPEYKGDPPMCEGGTARALQAGTSMGA